MSAQWWSQAISAVLFGFASVMILRGAFLGARSHAWPRHLLGITTSTMTAVYALGAFGVLTPASARDFIRGAGWVLAITLSLTAWTGVRFGMKVNAAAEAIESATQGAVDGEPGE
jgi:hypothetical protein